MEEYSVKYKASEWIIRYLRGELPAEESDELQAWLAEDPEHRRLFDDLTSEETLRADVKAIPALEHRILQQVYETVPELRDSIPMYRRGFVRWIAAACLILLVGLGTWLLFFTGEEQRETHLVEAPAPADVPAPDRTRATITLADGRTIALDSLNAGTLFTQDGVAVVRDSEGGIVYEGSGLTSDVSRLTYNVLSNPRGSKIVNITLADGTRVWLNSESSLKYPVAFTGAAREVEITGEAYFEVAKARSPFDKGGARSAGDFPVPFFVRSGAVTTEVLGTHFNVKAYNDDEDIRVTLLEGSVRVAATGVYPGLDPGRPAVKLVPGQQAVASDNGGLSTNNDPDLEAALAWKNGFTSFRNADIKTMMRQVARWYDIELAYEGRLPDRRFRADIPSGASLSEVLQLLKLNRINYRLEGRKLTITP